MMIPARPEFWGHKNMRFWEQGEVYYISTLYKECKWITSGLKDSNIFWRRTYSTPFCQFGDGKVSRLACGHVFHVTWLHLVDGRNPAPVDREFSHDFSRFYTHPWWCRISSNSMNCVNHKTLYRYKFWGWGPDIPSPHRSL